MGAGGEPDGGGLAERGAVDLEALAEQLCEVGTVRLNPFLLRAEVGGYTFTVFPDGRTIVTGTEDVAEAKTAHAKFIGS